MACTVALIAEFCTEREWEQRCADDDLADLADAAGMSLEEFKAECQRQAVEEQHEAAAENIGWD